MIIAIDPGTTHSAYVIWDGLCAHRKGLLRNETLLESLASEVSAPHSPIRQSIGIDYGLPKGNHLVIEQIRSYGMAVGAEVFDTVFWSGRFAESWSPRPWSQMPRMDVKMHLCHSARAKDANISRALKDRFGEIGTVKNPNYIYGEQLGNKDAKMKKDMWAALALAVTWWDTQGRAQGNQERQAGSDGTT